MKLSTWHSKLNKVRNSFRACQGSFAGNHRSGNTLKTPNKCKPRQIFIINNKEKYTELHYLKCGV